MHPAFIEKTMQDELQDLEEGLVSLFQHVYVKFIVFQYVYLKVLVSNAECDAPGEVGPGSTDLGTPV